MSQRTRKSRLGRSGPTDKLPGPAAWLAGRRYRSRLIIAAVLIVAFLIVRTDRHGLLWSSGDDWTRYHNQTFELARVIDGDTIIIRQPDGREPITRVRFWGVDTPELKRPPRVPEDEPFAQEAKARVEEWLADGQVRLVLQRHQTRDVFGRLLAFPHDSQGRCLGTMLLTEGLATAERRFSHERIETFQALEEEARRQGLGIWSGRR